MGEYCDFYIIIYFFPTKNTVQNPLSQFCHKVMTLNHIKDPNPQSIYEKLI